MDKKKEVKLNDTLLVYTHWYYFDLQSDFDNILKTKKLVRWNYSYL